MTLICREVSIFMYLKNIIKFDMILKEKAFGGLL